jgi:hypothetical protein
LVTGFLREISVSPYPLPVDCHFEGVCANIR